MTSESPLPVTRLASRRVRSGRRPGRHKRFIFRAHTALLKSRECPMEGSGIVSPDTFFGVVHHSAGDAPRTSVVPKAAHVLPEAGAAAPPTPLGGFGQPVVLLQEVDDDLGFEHLQPEVGIDEKGNLHLSRPHYKIRTLSAPFRHIVKSIG